MHIITLDAVTDIAALTNDLGHDYSPVPGPQFFDVDKGGIVSSWDGDPDPDASDAGPVAALVFSDPATRTFITDAMLVPWSSINGDPDPQGPDQEIAVYLDRALFALVVQNN